MPLRNGLASEERSSSDACDLEIVTRRPMGGQRAHPPPDLADPYKTLYFDRVRSRDRFADRPNSLFNPAGGENFWH